MSAPASHPERAAIRREMRQARRALSPAQVDAAAQALGRRVGALPCYVQARTVGGYLAMPGEMDPMPVMRMALAEGKRCFVPVITGKRLRFAPWTPDSLLREGAFGIREPAVATEQLLLPQALELVLVPLVAFDGDCNRLGMGGGFYDRSFEGRAPGQSPALIGIAHELQKVSRLDPQPWDVPLDCVVTERHTYRRDTVDCHRNPP